MANPSLQALDGLIHTALAAAGLADGPNATEVRYFPKDASEGIPCRVYVDRAVQVIGETGQLIGQRDEVTFVLEGMAQRPAPGGRVCVGIESFTLNKPISDDGSLSRWIVRNG